MPNEATPEILTAGPIGSEGGACQIAMRELPARFIDQTRRQVSDVARGDGLIGIVQAGRGAWPRSALPRPVSSRCSRHRGCSGAELIFLAELVIDLCQRN